jgi:hypothetical protein
MLELVRLYRDRPAVEDLIAIDEPLATELQNLLAEAGYAPARLPTERTLAEVLAGADVVRTGEPRATPATWDAAWEGALCEWIAVENLEERMAATGWIDPRVLEFLRQQADSRPVG